jgi:hypothetical protein
MCSHHMKESKAHERSQINIDEETVTITTWLYGGPKLMQGQFPYFIFISDKNLTLHLQYILIH